MKDYYELLGVSRDASTVDIKQAYRERIKEVHPDVSDEEGASERTKQLIEAKEVLSDPSERQRYDQIGHESYVNKEATATPRSSPTNSEETATTSETGSDANTGSQSNTTTDSGTERSAADAGSEPDGSAGSGAGATASGSQTAGGSRSSETRQDYSAGRDSWYDSSSRSGSATAEASGSSPAWDPGRSYAVKRESGNLNAMDILSSERSIVLFASTFMVYPVLLFGSLSPQFPTVVNLVVLVCTVLVIAFLQSVPTVGLIVFGVWSVLLPPIIVLWLPIGLLSLYGLLSLVGVVFPLGLSGLTLIAIRPMSIT